MGLGNLIGRDWALFDETTSATFVFIRNGQKTQVESVQGLTNIPIARTARIFAGTTLDGSESGFFLAKTALEDKTTVFIPEPGDKLKIAGNDFWYTIIGTDERTFRTRYSLLTRRDMT